MPLINTSHVIYILLAQQQIGYWLKNFNLLSDDQKISFCATLRFCASCRYV